MNNPQRNTWDIHRDNVRAILERDFSYSLMNNTKWMEVFDVLHTFRVRTRAKRLFALEPDQWTLPSGSAHSWLPRPFIDESHPFPVVDIEWLEIEPFERTENNGAETQIDHSAALEERLKAFQVPFLWQEGVMRIVGHQRKTIV